ncbi:pentatricopeptide repeat-containing protein At4g02820, mitochondrial [Rhodamnia argentea]|uniref:Pentatricopeptide repeat-containing protein At4g02820, mitochondrial n=1 Tax=Rhodamnia argentea TaxID=178133 RepID=A0A8B8QFJ6_9MYRT|nr:pentatricopeptide repeat-containing protein At4g02820, mitochondrial [Rhodamnia argentea]
MLLRSIRASLPTVVRRFSAEATVAAAAAEVPEATSASAAAASSVDTAAGTTVALAADIPKGASASAAVDTAVDPVAEVPVEASVSTATDKAADSPASTIASASTAAKVSEGAVTPQRDEGGRSAAETQLRRTISMLSKSKRYKRALELCKQMTLRQDMKLFPRDYTVHLELIDKVHGLSAVEKFFEDLPAEKRCPSTCNALLGLYVHKLVPRKAEALMARMSTWGLLKSPVPYNHMISLYTSNGQLEKVPGVIEELKRTTSPDTTTYNLWLNACKERNDVGAAEKVFREMESSQMRPNWVTYSILAKLYIKNAALEKASLAVKKMERRISLGDRSAYSSLLSLLTDMGAKDGVHRIWNRMRSVIPNLNDNEYACMISSVAKFGEMKEAEKLYTEWEWVSKTRYPCVADVLVAAHVNSGPMERAENIYKRVVKNGVTPHYTTWRHLTWGYLKEKQLDKALYYLYMAIASVEKWVFDRELMAEVFKNLEESGNVEGAEELLVVIRNAGHVNTEVYNSLLRTYAKASLRPLFVAERMKKDNVRMDDETTKLLNEASKSH